MNTLSTSLKTTIFTILLAVMSVFLFSIHHAFAEEITIENTEENNAPEETHGFQWNISGILADVSNPFGLDNRIKTDASTTDDLQTSVVKIINYLLGFLALALVVIIIYSGTKIIFSDGDEEVVTGARTTIIYAILGLAIIVLSWTLVDFMVGVATGGKNSNN